jgi:hypothetical protein
VTAAYRFGSLELQPDQRRLLVDGRPAALGPRAFDVLLPLVERAGELVSKNQLLDLVWPGLVVEENNLQVQIMRHGCLHAADESMMQLECLHTQKASMPPWEENRVASRSVIRNGYVRCFPLNVPPKRSWN